MAAAAPATTLNIGVIVCSVRSTRVNLDLAEWIVRTLTPSVSAPFQLTLIDLKNWELPLFNEPNIPALKPSTTPLVQKWSALVASMNAFIFVTPQYNWGYPASVKNAIDYLYHEWKGKPAMVVSYGGHGGEKCAAQLAQVFNGLRMKVVPPVCMVFEWESMLDKDGKLTNVETNFAAYADPLRAGLKELQKLLQPSL